MGFYNIVGSGLDSLKVKNKYKLKINGEGYDKCNDESRDL